MTTAQIIDAIKAEGGFDTSSSSVSRATILGWVNDRYLRAVSDAKWRTVELEMGPTVADQAQYAIPTNVVDIRSLQVGTSRPWLRVTTEEMWSLAAGGSTVYDVEGAFAPNFEADGDQVVHLWPTPSEAGGSIKVLAALIPTALTDSSGSSPSLPEDLQRPILVKGGVAEGRSLVDERTDLAAPYEQSYADGVSKLKARKSSRVGSGAWQARVGGR